MEELKSCVYAGITRRDSDLLIRKMDILEGYLMSISAEQFRVAQEQAAGVTVEKETVKISETEILRKQLELLAVVSKGCSTGNEDLIGLSKAMTDIAYCISALEQTKGQGVKAPVVEMKEFASMDEFAEFIVSQAMDALERHSPFN